MEKVLVTGASGFIGSHLTEALVKKGYEVTAFVKYNLKNDWGFIDDFSPEVKKKVRIILGDLRDPDAVRGACKGKDMIFHLGALIAIPYSYSNPREFFDTNTIGTLNVMIGAKENKVMKIVHTSTSEVYGTAIYTPIDERHPLQGQSPYSASKIGADKVVESFQKTYNMPIVTVRPFNTYGPRQSARAIIPTIISQALVGNSIMLGDLNPKRDFTFVTDTVSGFLKAGDCTKAVGETINLGSGYAISIGELVNIIKGLLNKPFKVVIDKKRIRPEKSEVRLLIADTLKARSLIKWEPKISFEEGLSKTINYIRAYISRYKPGVYNV